jgi:hypothetical protein
LPVLEKRSAFPDVEMPKWLRLPRADILAGSENCSQAQATMSLVREGSGVFPTHGNGSPHDTSQPLWGISQKVPALTGQAISAE